jgi:tetratricopeptide (TPR) repeat protein
MAFKRDAVLASAEKLLARGKYDAALKEYLRILEENPQDILVLNKVGDLYVTINRPMDSIVYFNRIAEHYGKDGFFLKAIAIYKKINKIDPSRLEVYNLLGDLYHKQGLVPEARAQYQILADYYQKQNQLNDAIAVYKKMASVDPNDIKIPVKLADLLTSAGKTDEALMQYGVIGSMLVKRGAVDEAVSVYQKALKIRPGDTKILHDLVRSLIENGNAAAAAQLLKSQPRNASTMTLLADALLVSQNLEEARRAAEGAIAFEDGNEEARQILARVLVTQHEPAKAFEALRPVIDKIVRSGEVKKAIGLLAPFAQPGAAGRPVFEKLLELHRMTGDREGMIADYRYLAQEAESRHDAAAVSAFYRQWLEIDPDNAEARTRVGAAPPAGPLRPAAAAPASGEAAQEEELVLDIDDSALTAPAAPVRATVAPSPLSLDWEEDFSFGAKSAAAPAGGAPAPPPQTPPPAAAPPLAPPPPPPAAPPPSEDVEWKNSVTEAEVFAKYGLIEKAAEKYRLLVRRRKDDLALRRRYLELLAETRSGALAQEAAELERDCRAAGETAIADAVRSRYLKPAAAAPAEPSAPPPPSAPELPAPRFTMSPAEAAAPPAALDFEDFGALGTPGAPPSAMPPSPTSIGPVDLDFTLDAGLGKAIEDEMAKFQTVAPEEPPAHAAPVDEMALFSDEQNFFNLAAELERELADEEAPPTAPELDSVGQEASLEEIFREFKKGVEQQLSPEDYETHYNLGIAYKEMGLTDEAIGEFQIASKDSARAVECCSMLGLCFLEKGLPQLAMQWYSKGLENPAIKPEERLGLQYDLASIHEQTGEVERAYQIFLDIYGQNTNYRDIVHRVKNLEAARRT